MILDTHVHTRLRGEALDYDRIAPVGRERSLDGVCLTEHDFQWPDYELGQLRARFPGFIFLRGQETIASDLNLLIFGYPDSITRDHSPDAPGRITEMVHRVGGAVVLAHPFRHGAIRAPKPEDLFSFLSIFDAIEVSNSSYEMADFEWAAEVARATGLRTTGGSDAHSEGPLGTYVTEFDAEIRTETDLIRALRSGGYRALARR